MMKIIKKVAPYLLACGLTVVLTLSLHEAKADIPAGYTLVTETKSKNMNIYEYRHKDTGLVITVTRTADGGVSTMQLVQGRGGYHLDAKEYRYYKSMMEGK